MNTMETILAEASTLPLVPLNSAREYHERAKDLTRRVDQELSAQENIDQLIGNNPLQMMYDNHNHHSAFMATVFGIGGYELLARTVPWVYRAYHSHGFSYDYFPAELKSWRKAVLSIMQERGEQIVTVYDWMLTNHEKMIALAEAETENIPLHEKWLEIKNEFRDHLLEGNFSGAYQLAEKYSEGPLGIKDLYLHIIQPVMYEIGRLWENADISVAHEHLASAIVSRIMAGKSGDITRLPESRGKAVITSAPGEYHEIGAWMISDILEEDGWQVRYLGANTPENDLLSLIDDSLPDILVLSVTMPFNLDKTKSIIEAIRDNNIHNSMKILVGGRVFIDNPEIVVNLKADGFAANLDEALRVTRSWC